MNPFPKDFKDKDSKDSKDSKDFNILLVEDNPADMRLALEALKESRIPSKVQWAQDGKEALDVLYRRGAHRHAVRPDLILLDLNMPRVDGREVLAQIKTDNHLRRIPVVVLTTSGAQQDILRCYELHANCYIVKCSSDIDSFIEVILSIQRFWLTVVTLPPASGD